MTKILLIFFFIWLILHNLQKLLSTWRIKRANDTNAELEINDSNGWNHFVNRFFGFLKFVVFITAALFALIIIQTW